MKSKGHGGEEENKEKEGEEGREVEYLVRRRRRGGRSDPQ